MTMVCPIGDVSGTAPASGLLLDHAQSGRKARVNAVPPGESAFRNVVPGTGSTPASVLAGRAAFTDSERVTRYSKVMPQRMWRSFTGGHCLANLETIWLEALDQYHKCEGL
jgi:hypothetical protein